MTDSTKKPITFQGDLAKLRRALAPLIERRQWAVWRWTQKLDGTWQKPPFQALQPDRHASTSDPSTWAHYEAALDAVETGRADGITYVLTESDPFAATDLDHCRDAGTRSIDVWAQNFLDAGRRGYSEITPSGTGCRIWGLADGKSLHRKFTLDIDGKLIAAELFRRTDKALTVTGLTLNPTIHELANIDKVIDWGVIWGERRKAAAAEAAATVTAGTSFNGGNGSGYSVEQIEQIVRVGAPAGANRSDTFHTIVGHFLGCGWDAEQIFAHLQQFPDGIGGRYLHEGRLSGEIARSARKYNVGALPLPNAGGWANGFEVKAPASESSGPDGLEIPPFPRRPLPTEKAEPTGNVLPPEVLPATIEPQADDDSSAGDDEPPLPQAVEELGEVLPALDLELDEGESPALDPALDDEPSAQDPSPDEDELDLELDDDEPPTQGPADDGGSLASDPELDDELLDNELDESEVRPAQGPDFPPMYAHGDPDPRPLKSWLIKDLMSTCGHGLLSGQWGTCKTFVLFDLAAAVMTGQPFLGRMVKRQCGVLLIAAEGAEEVRLRLEAVVRAKCGGMQRAPFRWYEDAPTLLQKGAIEKLIAMAKQADASLRDEFELPLGLIIIDTLAACTGFTRVGEENDAAAGTATMNALKAVAQATGCFVLGVAHFGKDLERGTRGTSSREDAGDLVLACLGKRQVSGDVIETRLAVRKHRGGRQGQVYPFTLRTVEAPELDEDGEPITTMVIDWLPLGTAGEAPTQPEPDPWGQPKRQDQKTAVLRLKRVLMSVLADQGVDLPIPPDGPTVRMIDQAIVRAEFYVHTPIDGTPEQKRKARHMQFNRALAWAEEKQLIGVEEIGEVTYLRLTRPDPQSSDEAEFDSQGPEGDPQNHEEETE